LNIYSRFLVGWIIVILVLTWTPGNVLPKPDLLNVSLIEFLAHFSMFLVFSFLLTGAIIQNKMSSLSKGQIIFVILLISVIFSFFTETGQYLIPGRYFHGVDIGINFIGSLIGIWLFFMKFKYFSK
jgi:VanZ family protein